MSIRTIKYTAKYEDLISRIPGLFAYIELDDKGNSVLHKATDSPMGCYSKVIENVKYNGKIYNYKELLNRYYNNDISNDLKDFVEKGIGKENVIFDTLDRKKQDLVPDFVYLALVKPLYGEMLKLRDKVNFYKNHTDNRDKIDNETEESLDCVCKLYERHGGDGYLRFLGGLFSKVEAVSNEYFNYANEAINDKNRLCLNYAVNLFSTVNDTGLVTPMEDFDKRRNKEYDGFILEGKTNSKLISLRRYEGYLNEFDVLETPPIGTDWLYYYRVGAVRNISTINDENGNIKCENTELNSIKVNNTINDLYAFGDVIESIEPVGDNGIKIVYWTDVHLKATVNKITKDDDGNYKVYYINFIPDYPDLDALYKDKVAIDYPVAEGKVTINSKEYTIKDYKVTIDSKEYTVVDVVTIGETEYSVEDGKVTIDEKEYPVENGKVTIDGKEYEVDGKVTIEYVVKNGKVTIEYVVKNDKVTINDKEYTVEDGKVIIEGKEYPVVDGKVTIDYPVVDVVTINGTEYSVVGCKITIDYTVVDGKVTVDGKEYIVKDGKVTVDGKEYIVKDGKVTVDYPVVYDKVTIDGNEYTVEKKITINENYTFNKLLDLTDTDCRRGIRYEEIYYYSPNEDEDNISYLLKDKVTIEYVVKNGKVTINDKEYTVVGDKVTIGGIEYTVVGDKVTIDGVEYTVVDDKVIINDTEYTVVDGKVTIGGVEYPVVDDKVIIDYSVVDGKVTIGGVDYSVVDGKVTIKKVEYPIIKNKDFYKYVNGDYDDKQADAKDAQNIKKYEKYEFSIDNNTLSYTQRVNDTDLQLSCVMADYKTICIREKNNKDDSQFDGVAISRLPFYEGISYTPTEKIDVFIDRGSTSVFDRHIRLSEVKTLNDMLEYSNGSYFTMQN